ncbi:MAG: hypothetical protein WCF93_03720 [Candidatus Moraniibacteriota bacterium]
MTLPTYLGPSLMDIGLIAAVLCLLYALHLSEKKTILNWLFWSLAMCFSILITAFGACLAFSLPYPKILSHSATSRFLFLASGIITSATSFPMARKMAAEENQFKLMLFWLVAFFFGFFLMSCYFAPLK